MSYCSTHLVPKAVFARHKRGTHLPVQPGMYGVLPEKPSTMVMAHAGCLGSLLGEAGKRFKGVEFRAPQVQGSSTRAGSIHLG